MEVFKYQSCCKIDVKNPNIIKDYNALLCNTITHNSISPATGALGQIE